MYQVNKISEILLQALEILVILHLIEIDFLTKYLVENAVNSISESLDTTLPAEARASGARFIKVIDGAENKPQ